MVDALRPHVATLAGHAISDVEPLSGGGYAVLVRSGIVLLDAALAKRGEILGEQGLDRLSVLPGEQRFVAHADGRWPYEGSIGGALAKIETMEGLTNAVAVTDRGYIAIGSREFVVDVDGVKTKLAIEGRTDHGGCAWRGGAVIAGSAGIAILSADGAVRAQVDVPARGTPVALPDAIAVRTDDGITLFDGDAHVIGQIPVAASFLACGAGVLTLLCEEDRRASVITCWEGSDARWERVFSHDIRKAYVVGDHVVITHEKDVWILDRATGNESAKLSIGEVHHVDGFGDGIAFSARNQTNALWWRRDHDVVQLQHDVSVGDIWQVPAGLVTHEANVLYVWRTDEQGPEWTPVATTIPMSTPIVVGGVPVRVLAAGRFALRAETLERKEPWRVEPDAKWRPLITREDATRIVERLVARSFDRPLPAADAELEQLPPAQAVDLHGKAMFAASTLDEAAREKSMFSRGRFFDELGLALGTSGRSLLAAVRARKMTLVPPRPLPGYEYLGSFTTSGALEVSDPCYVGRKSGGPFSLSLKVAGHEGVWHVFVRNVQHRTAELVTVHDDGFDVYATDGAGMIGVDSGSAGVFDKKCPKRDPNYALEEGTFAALGAIASTGWGDGAYPVYVGKLKGRVAKIRIHYIGDDPEVDRTVAKPKSSTAKPYSATAKFALGDTVEHVKFGAGSVIRVGSDGKIDVRFSDGTRTLVHGKK